MSYLPYLQLSLGHLFNLYVSLSDSTTSPGGGRSPGPNSGFPAATSSISGSAGTAGNVQSSATATGPARYRDKNGRGESALHAAAIKGDFELARKLLDQGMNPNVTDNAG